MSAETDPIELNIKLTRLEAEGLMLFIREIRPDHVAAVTVEKGHAAFMGLISVGSELRKILGS